MSNVLELKKKDAIKAWRDGDDRDRSLLERLYGKNTFNQDIREQVKSFEDACDVLGLDPNKVLPDVSYCLENEKKGILALAKLSIIRRALNGDFVADYANGNQYKWSPYFLYKPGSGFAFDGTRCDHSRTYVGARLSYKTSDLAEYAGTQFIDLYNDLLSI